VLADLVAHRRRASCVADDIAEEHETCTAAVITLRFPGGLRRSINILVDVSADRWRIPPGQYAGLDVEGECTMNENDHVDLRVSAGTTFTIFLLHAVA
jgi:hypothetical protein